jgi:hypothetical protein
MRNVLAAALSTLFLFVAGCGYHTAGSATHLPNTVHTLAVPVFQNTTQSYHTEVAFTQAVIHEFSSRTAYHLEPGNDPDADATLQGTITLYQVVPLTYNSQTGQSSRFLIAITRFSTRIRTTFSASSMRPRRTWRRLFRRIRRRCSAFLVTLRRPWSPIFWSPSDGI